MPNKIDTDSIVRDRQDKMKDSADHSNAEYVTNLEKTSSIMPPEKPFETEKAQNQKHIKEDTDHTAVNKFVQNVKDSTNDITAIDKNNETKLHLLQLEYDKVAEKLGLGNNKKDESSLASVLDDVQDKIELYKSKLKAGVMTAGAIELEAEMVDGEGDGDGVGDAILDGVKDQVLMTAPGLIIGAKDDEEEEKEKEEGEKEYDQ